MDLDGAEHPCFQFSLPSIDYVNEVHLAIPPEGAGNKALCFSVLTQAVETYLLPTAASVLRVIDYPLTSRYGWRTLDDAQCWNASQLGSKAYMWASDEENKCLVMMIPPWYANYDLLPHHRNN